MTASKGLAAPSIDAQTGKPIDPTANVIALNEASDRRQDDLRSANEKYTQAAIDHMRELSTLRAMYQEKLSEAEAKRIDAIRAVDVNAVAVASERQSAAANVLAAQVAQSADALRTLVNTTATAQAEQQRQSTQQITDRITAVERSQYEGRGKQLVADPMMAEMVAEMKALRASNDMSKGKQTYSDPMIVELVAEMKRVRETGAASGGASAGKNQMWGWVAGGIGLILALITVAVNVITKI